MDRSLANNAFQGLVNASFPSTLEHLSLANNDIERIELTEFPANLKTLDLTGNPLQFIEIRESDIPVFQNANILPVLHTQTPCANPQATLATFQSHDVCVIPDAVFNQKKYANRVLVPDTEVHASVGSSSSSSTTTIALNVFYVVLGVAFAFAAVFIALKMRRKRREKQAADRINEYLDASGLTPPPDFLLSRNQHTLTSGSANTAATGQPYRTLPRLQSSSPQGFLTPFLRVLSGVKHEPREKSGQSLKKQSSMCSISDEVALDAAAGTLAVEKYRIAEDDLKFGRLVSKGSFTHVYMAKFTSSGKETIGLAKQLAPNLAFPDSEMQKQFMGDVYRCFTISHPNIATFFGFYHLNNVVPGVVTEYLPNGDLESMLATKRENRHAFQWLQSDSLSKTKAEIALDVIDALVYLHSLASRVYFRNVRAKKVLLTEDFTAKLCTFSIGRSDLT
uniref:Protein kinase domain-containing protein n=1 Tax=Globisporangium ultimum (strain ATCC 200006 / CBS 805.95 / DAOM BR144) TaxID=431595 RepID=K3WCH7_GLOUD